MNLGGKEKKEGQRSAFIMVLIFKQIDLISLTGLFSPSLLLVRVCSVCAHLFWSTSVCDY